MMLALVLDDSRAMRMILTRQLTELGFEVIEGSNGQEGISSLEAQLERGITPDLALVDWNMPEVDGLTFLQHVMAQPAYRTMTVMMVTTESEKGQIVKALAAGAHEYVIKPFTPDVITEKLAMLGFTVH